jgi:hypothetical protein
MVLACVGRIFEHGNLGPGPDVSNHGIDLGRTRADPPYQAGRCHCGHALVRAEPADGGLTVQERGPSLYRGGELDGLPSADRGGGGGDGDQGPGVVRGWEVGSRGVGASE